MKTPTKEQIDAIIKTLNKFYNMDLAQRLWENFPRTLTGDIITEWEKIRS